MRANPRAKPDLLGQLPHGALAGVALCAGCARRPPHEALITSSSVWHTTSWPPSVVAAGLEQVVQPCLLRMRRAIAPGSRMHWPSGRSNGGLGGAGAEALVHVSTKTGSSHALTLAGLSGSASSPGQCALSATSVGSLRPSSNSMRTWWLGL